jgi:anti-sigma factor RsiW
VDCTRVQLKLSDFVDGRVDRDEVVAMEAHLACCDECRAAWTELREIDDLLRSEMAEVEPPADLWKGLEARLAGERAAEAWAGRSAWARLGQALPRLRSAVVPAFVVVLVLGFAGEAARHAMSGRDQALQAAAGEPAKTADLERAQEQVEAMQQAALQEEVDQALAEQNEEVREIRWQIVDRTVDDYLRELRLRATEARCKAFAEGTG